MGEEKGRGWGKGKNVLTFQPSFHVAEPEMGQTAILFLHDVVDTLEGVLIREYQILILCVIQILQKIVPTCTKIVPEKCNQNAEVLTFVTA